MIKVNDKQVNKIMINGKEVLKVVLNGATKYQKNTTPQWSEWKNQTDYTRYFQTSWTTNLTTPPEIVVIQVQGVNNGIVQNTPYFKNNYFISGRSANIINGQTTTIILYPIWTQSGNSYSCNMYNGSTSGESLTCSFNATTGVFQYTNRTNSSAGNSVSTKVRIIFNYDPTFEEESFTRIYNNTWNWNVNNSSSWGSNPTAFQNFTLPITYTRIKFNSITNNNATPTYMILKQNINYGTNVSIDTTNLNKYIIEFDANWMTKSNTTTPISGGYYFDMYGGTFNATVDFFPAEYVNSGSNRFSWQRKSVSGTANITLSFEVYIKQ